jgi:hypothetical protein
LRSTLISLALLLTGSCLLPAQSVNGPGDAVLCTGYVYPPLRPANDQGRTIDRRFFPPPPLYAVTGKPFSARRVLQDLQIRADGTKICGIPQIRGLYRDSAGRTREEDSFSIEGPDGNAAPSIVKITDPSAQIQYVLDMVTRTAYRLSPMKQANIVGGTPVATNPTIIYKTENLGKHPFEGIEVEGQLTTTTGVPLGSTVPLSVTNEIWRSPDLGLVVLQKSVNPSSSKTDVYLRISTADPDPSLFTVPDGWKIVDGVASTPQNAGNAYHTAAGYQYTWRFTPPTRSDFVVTDAPYSAERTGDTSSNLAGIAGLSHVSDPAKIYRDSSGRTRTEMPRMSSQPGDAQGPPIFPEIDDPDAGVQIILDPLHKIAHRFALPGPATNPPPQVVPDSGHPDSVESDKDLGEETIGGVKATGYLRTYRIPAGARGNDREITETTESWYSPDLRIIVRAKFNTVTQTSGWQLTNMSTAEPDPALFEIPAGYTVVDEKALVTITVTQP